MPDIKGNNQKIYDYLSSQRVQNIGANADEFQQKMSDEENRRKVYDYLHSKNVKNIGADYDEFAALVYDAGETAAQTDAPSQAGTPASRTRTNPRTAAFNERVRQADARHTAAYADRAAAQMEAETEAKRREVEERRAREAAEAAQAEARRESDRAHFESNMTEFDRMRKSLNPVSQISDMPEDVRAALDEDAARERTREELEAVKARSGKDRELIREYENRRREYEDNVRKQGYVRGDMRNRDMAAQAEKLAAEKKWLDDNEYRYDAAKRQVGQVDRALGVMNNAQRGENLERIGEKRRREMELLDEDWRKAVMSGPRGSIPFNPGTAGEREEDLNHAAASSYYGQAEQQWNQGSKYDEGYEGDVADQVWTAISQFVSGAANNIDLGSFTMGLTEGSAAFQARKAGEHYNELINSAMKELGYGDADVKSLLDSVRADNEALRPLVESLNRDKAQLDAMKTTYEDMVRSGDPKAEAYAREYNRKIDEYNRRIKDEYDPVANRAEENAKKYDDLMAAVDAAVAEGLTDGEKAVLDAMDEFTKAKMARMDDVSRASKGGAGAEQSAEFMLDFILTGGIAKAGTKAATKIATRRLLKREGADALRKLAAVGKKVEPGFGLKFATDMVTAGIRTAVMGGRNLQAAGEKLTEYEKDDMGRYAFSKSRSEAAIDTALSQFIEYWSEGFGEYFGAGEQWLFRKATKLSPKTVIGQTLKNYRGSIGKYLDYGKFDGMFNEMLEEVVGSTFNALNGLVSGNRVGDKDALKEFFEWNNLSTLFLSFLPMSTISSATNISAYNKMKQRYDMGVKTLDPFIKDGAIDREELDELANGLSDLTPKQAREKVDAITDKARVANGGRLPKNFGQAVMGYLEGSLALNYRNEEWENSQEKLAVVNAYTYNYSNPNPLKAWDLAQAENETRASAEAAGFSEFELNRDSYILGQEALEMRAEEGNEDRADALMNYATAKAAREGLLNGYQEEGQKWADAYGRNVRDNLDSNGRVVTANIKIDGQDTPVFITSNDAEVTADGGISTPTGDGVVTYRVNERGEERTAKAGEFSGAESMETERYISDVTGAVMQRRQARFEQAERTVSPMGRSRAISQKAGQSVIVRDHRGVYQPVRVERMTDGGTGVVISGDAKFLQGVATAMGMQTPAGKYLEAPTARLWDLLSKEEDGSLSTEAPEMSEEELAEAEARAAAAPEVSAKDTPTIVSDSVNDGAPTMVRVTQVGKDGVFFEYEDEKGDLVDGAMPLYDFQQAMQAESVSPPAPAQETAAAKGGIPVDQDTGDRIYDHPSVSPARALDALLSGVKPGSKDEANRMKYIGSKAAAAVKAVEDAENRLAGLQTRRDAVDNRELPDGEELDAFERRKAEERAKIDEEMSQVASELPELRRRAAHWNAVRERAARRYADRMNEERENAVIGRAASWTARTGVNVKFFRSPDEVDDARVKAALMKGERVAGWYNDRTGEVGIYLPYINDEADMDKTFIHEVVSHKGLRELLGDENYDKLCDKVWDQLMTEADRKKYTAYNSHLKGMTETEAHRAAADEWIANLSENLDVEANRSLFERLVDFVKEFLDNLLSDGVKITRDDVRSLLRSSLARYVSETEDGKNSLFAGIEAERKAKVVEDGVSSETQAAQLDDNAIRFNIRTENEVERKIRAFARTKEGRKLGWTEDTIESVISETADLMRAIHASLTGDKYYDEWSRRDPTMKIDWRDGVEKPTVTWSRANIEYKYDMSADLLCINNEGLETVLASPTMAELMLRMNATTEEGFTSDDYLLLYETLRDLGFVVPCKGCFDAAARLKMLPSVARNFVDEVNAAIDERNRDPEAFDQMVREMGNPNGARTVEGFPVATSNKADAILVGVAGDKLTEHISWTQLMSAEGQTKALSDWGGIFRAWQKTGAGRPKDKLLPEPWSGDIVSTTTTIIGKQGEKTPSYRDISVNQGTGLRRNSHSEFRPILAIDEIQFMREAFIRGLTVFKYMKELDDVRLFGKLGVKFNMSFFPAYVEGGTAAGLDADGNYIASEESVGGHEFEYVSEDGKTHYDGMKGWREAQKYVNKDVSLSSVIFSIPHLIKAMTDVPTKSDPRGLWGSIIPFHASGATAKSLLAQGLGHARAISDAQGHGFDEAFTDYDKGVTNFEAVQNDRFGEGWVIVEGRRAGEDVKPGHKLEFSNGTHYHNEKLQLHLFKSSYIFDSEVKEHEGEGLSVKELAEKYGHPYSIDYNDKVREIGTDTAYQDAADYYIGMLRQIGLIPRFDFEVPEEKFLEMCAAAKVDPNHPKLGWKGEGHPWNPVDSEAYYSMFCDYGMIDPETGKWAPHYPVGVVDAEGNRRFELPENTIDIIKDGVARYSERRSREDARELDAIEEFARREVAAGKLSQEDADAIIAEARTEQESPDVDDDGSWTHFRKLEDPAKIAELEAGEWEDEAYRAVQFVPDPNGEWEYDLGDGKGMQRGNVYPPMSAQTENGTWRDPIRKGVIEESEEAPGKAILKKGKKGKNGKMGKDRWVFRLHKGNGKYVDAAYNPYIHSSDTMLNDQFSEAQSRGNLVVMRVSVPKSELDGENPYQAEKALNHVGRHDWKAGPIQGELTGTRTVYLSRYDKPQELVPIEKVGESVAKMLKGQVDVLPTNVVWPQLRSELEKRGFQFVETNNQGKLVSGEDAGKTWKQVYGKKKPAKKKQKKTGTSTRFRIANQTQNGFISNAEAALDRIKMEKATPEQWVKMLEKEGGLKAGEDKWLGLSDWLKAQDKKSLTKQEVADYIAENRIQIDEVQYGGSLKDDIKDTIGRGRDLAELQEEIDELKESDDYQTIGDAWLRDEFLRDEMKERYGEDFEMGYSIVEGNIDYNVDQFSDMEYRENYDGPTRPINNVRLGYTTEGLDNKREIALTVPTVEPYHGSAPEIHFDDESTGGRAVAWARFGDTVDENGNRVLVIDEIQSQRHEDAREKGYRPSVDDYMKEKGLGIRETDKSYELYWLKDGRLKASISKTMPEAETEEKAKEYMVNTGMMGYYERPPHAPFEKNWHELAMKRMLRLAAEEGYDYVAWTTGEQQAERYDIGGVVESISYHGMDDGLKLVDINLKTGNGGIIHLGVNEDGVVERTFNGNGTTQFGSEYDGHSLSDIIGKENAERVMGLGIDEEISGEGLMVGGEGMKGFYDDILPRFMNKYGKKWGVKVQDITLPNVEEAGRVMHAVPVTQEMKESVMQGQTMFRKAPNGKESHLTDEQWEMVRTPEFKAWFGDWENDPANASKVVDENGEPLVVYRVERWEGDTADYTVFDENKGGNWRGFYFTNRDAALKNYGDESTLRAFFLDSKNPFTEKNFNILQGNKQELIDMGHDGMIFAPDGIDARNFEVKVFDPNQIKSADPVTYDDNGNVIPLSERFNSDYNDIRFSIRGVTGAMNDEKAMVNLSVARELEKNGEDAKTIWAATGWERGADGKWRNEIKDATPKEFSDKKKSLTVGDIVDAPELFESYPQLKDFPVTFKKMAVSGRYLGGENRIELDPVYTLAYNMSEDDKEKVKNEVLDKIRSGDLYTRTKVINYRAKLEKRYGTPVLDENGIETLLHELQHAVQEIEGFERGGSVGWEKELVFQRAMQEDQNAGVLANFFSRNNSASLLLKVGKDGLVRSIERNLGAYSGKDVELLQDLSDYLQNCQEWEFRDLVSRADMIAKSAGSMAKRNYNALGGEVEARNVEKRRKMSDEERRSTPPSETEDVPRDQQIVRSEDDVTRFRTKEDQEKEERVSSAEREAADKTVDEMAKQFGVGVKRAPRNKMPKGHATDKGYFDPETGVLTICSDNVTDERDEIATVIHETVGRNGLRELFGDEFNKAMVRVYASLDADGRSWVNGYISRNGLKPGDEAVVLGMEQYMAEVAKRDGGDFMDNVNEILGETVDVLFGTEGFRFTDRELEYVLRASYENSKDAGWLDTPAGRAKDTLWKRELGINESDHNKPTDPDGPDAGTRFRRADTGVANADYDAEMQDWRNAAKIELQNADLPVKVGIEKIMKEVGKQRLEDEEDYLTRHNISSSRAETESHDYMLFHFKPMLEKVREVQSRLLGGKSSKRERDAAYERILDYIYAVSGLERNEWERNNGGEAKDWSGLTSLMGYKDKADWRQAEADAQAMVDAFRAEVGDDALLDELWDAIRSCTDYSLDHAHQYGLITTENYERLRGTDTKPRLWNYYVPLRGFSDKTAEDMYDYVNFVSTDPKNNSEVVKDAKGRWTKADNPLANILNIAQREIVQGNENWARQALYRFAMNAGKNTLLSIRKPWYVKQQGTNNWVLAMPGANESIEDFEERMKAAKRTGDATQRRQGLKINYIMSSEAHQNQHLIRVKVGGEDRMLWVNGDPAFARAVSGAGGANRSQLGQYIRRASRAISNLFTTYSLNFTAKNLIRDTIYSRIALNVKEDKEYRKKFKKNWWSNGGFSAAAMVRLARQWDSGELQSKPNPTPKEQMFIDFMHDGGQTGYTVIRSVETIKRDLEKTMRRSGKDMETTGMKIANFYPKLVRTLNEGFELLTRFTAYQTSRDMGRSGQRAAEDAKEISVNFNRKGAQSGDGFWGVMASYLGATHYFFNAGVQGFDNFLRLFKVDGKKMGAVGTAFMSAGIAMPFINGLLAGGDGDDDWYWNIPEWVRRNSVIIGWPKFYLAIPLPVEFRAFYGIGDSIASAFIYQKTPNHTFGRVAMDLISTASGIVPVNPVEGYNGKNVDLKDAVLRSLAPDITMFFVDWITNEDYTGRALVKENKFKNTVPKSQGVYASTPKALVDACQTIGEWWGLDVPPGLVRDFLNNYLGGFYRVAEDMLKLTVADEEHPRRYENIPFFSGFTGHLDEDRSNTFVNSVLYEYKDMSEELVTKMNLYNRSDFIDEKMAFEYPETLPSKAKIQKMLDGRKYELAKMYYEGMHDRYTGETRRVLKVHQKGKSAGKTYWYTEKVKEPGVNTLRKDWTALRKEWLSMDDTDPDKAQKGLEVQDAWHKYWDAAADLAEKLLDYEYGN